MKTILIDHNGQKVKVKTRPISDKEQKVPRRYWIQTHWLDGTIDNQLKVATYHGVVLQVDVFMARHHESVEVVYLLDGNLPVDLLNFAPEQAIWNRWEASPFTDCGKVAVTVDVNKQLRAVAVRSAAGL